MGEEVWVERGEVGDGPSVLTHEYDGLYDVVAGNRALARRGGGRAASGFQLVYCVP